MEKVTKTFDEILDFYQEASEIVKKGEGDAKYLYALKKLVGDPSTTQKGSLTKYLKANQIKARDLQIIYASIDEKGNLKLENDGKYSYTKENKLALMTELDTLSESSNDIEPYYIELIPEGISEYHKELFKGFIIK